MDKLLEQDCSTFLGPPMEARHGPAPTQDPLVTGLSEPKSVWVVDDDETTLMLAEEVLGSLGFRVRTFQDAALALRSANPYEPDIIVLDVMMPEIDGFAFCARLRQNPATSDIPVLMVTSLNDSKSIALAYEAGATNFATKPVNWVAEGHRLRYMLRAAETASKLKVAEREARVGREDWERTFNAIPDVVTLLGSDFRVLRANAATAKAVKKPIELILGSTCHELFAGEREPCLGCPVSRAIRSGRPTSSEVRYLTPGADCLVSGSPLLDKGGHVLHVVHIARDLTEQKALEQQYLQAQKMEAVGTLAGGIAHDFNNILTAVTCCADLLRTDAQLVGDNRELADTILESSNRGAALARQLLTFSRRGAPRTEKRPLDLNTLVHDMLKMLSRVFPKRIAIRTELNPDPCPVDGSSDQLTQVLMNLATNSVHAMAAGGTLGIETRVVDLDQEECRHIPEAKPGRYVLLSVSDTGHGMDDETQRHMFEPFFTTKKVGEGTGLGLPVVYGIVQDHGGFLSCSSKVNTGTTFRLYFPAGAAGCAVDSQEGSTHAAQGGSETILLVDDDPSVRTAMKAGFLRLGYTVITAPDGEVGLKRFAEEPRIALVVVDLGMPKLDGWECLRRLKLVDPEVKVLITTGYGGQDLAKRASAHGARDLLPKPFMLNELFWKVRSILDGSGQT